MKRRPDFERQIMWVKITKAYAGPLGMFLAGQKYDISGPVADKLRKALGKGSVINICAPWEEGLDTKAIAATKLKKQANDAIAAAVSLRAEAVSLAAKAGSLVEPADKKQKLDKETNAAAEKAIEKSTAKNATDNDKQKTQFLVRAHEYANLEFEKAISELRLALAESGLKRMEAEDAEQKATKLAAATGIKFEPAGVAKTEAAGNSQG